MLGYVFVCERERQGWRYDNLDVLDPTDPEVIIQTDVANAFNSTNHWWSRMCFILACRKPRLYFAFTRGEGGARDECGWR